MVSPLASWTGPLVRTALQTPLQLTQFLFWYVFLLALGVGIVYVLLLLWALAKHISHEPLARDRPTKPSRGPERPPAMR